MIRETSLPKLVYGIRSILRSSRSDLTDLQYLVAVVRNIGLVHDPRDVYGADDSYMNVGIQGLWQQPVQFAKFLLFLSRYRIRTMIEIGTFTGWTASILTAYLYRCNPDFCGLTIDVVELFDAYRSICELIPLTYRCGVTSQDLRGSIYDLAFIDGDHSYEAARLDYECIGRFASICAFHDVNDANVMATATNGGVPRLWSEVRSSLPNHHSSIEILDHPQNRRIMGIGVVFRS